VDKIIKSKDGKYMFKCPGCGNVHGINNKIWNFNDDLEKPTINPSILRKDDRMTCHSFVTDGKIKFLNDSTHDLAGKKVDLLPVNSNNYDMDLVNQIRGR